MGPRHFRVHRLARKRERLHAEHSSCLPRRRSFQAANSPLKTSVNLIQRVPLALPARNCQQTVIPKRTLAKPVAHVFNGLLPKILHGNQRLLNPNDKTRGPQQLEHAGLHPGRQDCREQVVLDRSQWWAGSEIGASAVSSGLARPCCVFK